MNSLLCSLVILYLSSFTSCDNLAEETVSPREGRSQRTGGLLNHNNNNGGGGSVSSGYGAPSSGYGAGGVSSGYGAPSGGGGVSSGYGAPSGGGVSSGYGAPSGGGGVSSGYGAPCDSYGCGGGGGGGGGAPVYVYQQGQGQNQNNGGGAGGLLGALLPLGALALLVPLGLAAFGALFPTTTIVGAGRRRRSVQWGNETELEQQAMLLHSYMETLSQGPEISLQKDMVAKYLECGADQQLDSPSLHGCLQKLSCLVYDDSVNINESEREVANIVLESILANEFVSKKLKKRLLAAGKRGSTSPGFCHLYKCHHHLLPGQPGVETGY